MISTGVQVRIVQGQDHDLLIEIEGTGGAVLKMPLEAAQQLVEDLIVSVETVESLLARPDDHPN